MTTSTAELLIASLEEDGFARIDEAPAARGLKAGARVHHVNERFPRARVHGTATVIAVLRKGTDDEPDHWERTWGRPNVEIVIQRDPDHPLDPDGPMSWADYHTVLAIPDPTN